MALSRLPSRLVHAASMPTLATTVMELREAEMLFEVAGALDDSDASSSDEENADMLRLAACEPLMRRRLQNIGPERLSLARLQREYAARGFDDRADFAVWSCCGPCRTLFDVCQPSVGSESGCARCSGSETCLYYR